MVRVLSCYHFRGQKIGRCEEASAVVVAGPYIVVGIEDAINVYSSGQGFLNNEGCNDLSLEENILNQNVPDIGTPITFNNDGGRIGSSCSEQPHSGSCSSSVTSIESDTELKLSHRFSTIDLINSMTYNKRGNYLLCLEGKSSDGESCSIRIYFNWNRKFDELQARTRIAGVSPSSNDLEKPSLVMIEIPMTSPAIAVASCNLTGHLASLSAESIINIFSYRIKEASGRAKLHYPDFDRLCAVEVPGMSPESLSFEGNFIACTNSSKVHVFKLRKSDTSWSPSVSTSSKYGSTPPPKLINNNSNPNINCKSVIHKSKQNFDHTNKVTYDPSDESIVVHLPSISKANRKRIGNSTIIEEYTSEISSNKSRVIFSSSVAGVEVEDILRLSLPSPNSSQEKIVETGLYPRRIKDKLGGITCVVGMFKEAAVYFLPTKELSRPIRIAGYSFTAPLVSFTFDSLFFHALTESGLETYTSRCLYYALQDYEGFYDFVNACPLMNEPPCLVGIRPFVKVRFMAASESLICLLTCPTSIEASSGTANEGKPLSVASGNALLQDERLWTIYSLELPDVDMLYEDAMRVAEAARETQPDSYFTLLCELHLILRTCLNATPEDAPYYLPRYQKLCKSIGLELLLKATVSQQPCEMNESVERSNANFSPSTKDSSYLNPDLIVLGVTYLCMSGITVQDVFLPENSTMIVDQNYVKGTVLLLEVLLKSYFPKDNDKHNFSPSLTFSIVDFLSKHSPATLVEVVIKISFLRENQSTRLVEILQEYASTQGYKGKETVALILTLIASGGVESNVRSQVENVLQDVNTQDLISFLSLEYILDRSAKHTTLTDVAICLIAVNSNIPTTVISDAIANHEITISEVMLAFAKGVNLNSESQIQLRMAKALRVVLEQYLINLINTNEEEFKKGEVSDSTNKRSVIFNEDDRHAALAVVRSYISDITLSPTSKLFRTPDTVQVTAGSNDHQSSSQQEQSNLSDDTPSKEKQGSTIDVDNCDKIDVTSKNQIFGKIPSFVNFVLGVDHPGGSITPNSEQFCLTMFSNNKDSMESYIRLLSLLSSPCGKIEGVKDSVLSFVYNSSSSVTSTPLQLILLMFCEPIETAISILISRQPTTVLLYAKEMFGKSPSKWKILVTQLKKRINLNPGTVESDMFSTIIESVYLHLANTLTLVELEEVLEKGSDDVTKFHSTCKRVELANNYANMVIQISTDYLQAHK